MHRGLTGQRIWSGPLIAPRSSGRSRRLRGVARPGPPMPRGRSGLHVGGVPGPLCDALRLRGALLQGIGPISADPAFSTAISFVTNTNWRAYARELEPRSLSQMVGLTVRDFVLAAISMGVAVMRGLLATGTGTLGHFWIDRVRSTL